MKKLIYKKNKSFATYGSGPHHCIVAIKNPDGKWTSEIEEGDFQTVKDLYKTQERSNQTVKVYKLD